jgi:oxygen-independent coproporphyrinogen-3 oxidase
VSGIYVHIPFCKQACTYCDFHFSTQLKHQDKLIEALCEEISNKRDLLTSPVTSIYFGGGSPSVLSNENLEKLFEKISSSYDISCVEEITLESNPDDHSAENLSFWKSLGINRLSIGIQSFIDRDLSFMNRAHNANEAAHCVAKAKNAGFEHLTIDLIYGITNQSISEWKSNIEQAIALGVDHISAYCLTVESKTVLAHLVNSKKVTEKSDEEIETEYLMLHQLLEKSGFEHYEISNFASLGSRAIHNSNYWSGKPYLGFGPSAHSFDGNTKRSWNVSNNAAYIKAIRESESYSESEQLSAIERANEQIMTGLRRKNGVGTKDWSEAIKSEFNQNLAQLPPQLKQSLNISNETVSIQPKSWLMADAIIRELIVG